MAEEIRFFPLHRLPPGFSTTLDAPPYPHPPQPSATLALLRGGSAKLEVLLLKRAARSGFIPGAYVFPGGRVDPEDGSSELLARMDGITALGAREILKPTSPDPPAEAYWGAALRETFEETGVLLRSRESSGEGTDPEAAVAAEEVRKQLLSGLFTLGPGLEVLGTRLDARALVYIGHWITPECEPRRYDTRFFAAEAPPGYRVTLNHEEMVEALWLTPSEALARNRSGALPMVFPTVRTLEDLEPHRTPKEALEALSKRPVPRCLPRVVRADGKIGFALES